MSDQPDDQHNLEQRIPGLRQAVDNLAQTTQAAGFRLATIVVTHPPTRDGAPAPPTRITFVSPPPSQQQQQQEQQPIMAATTPPPERWVSGPPPPPARQWRLGEPLPSLTQIQAIQQRQRVRPQPPPQASSPQPQTPQSQSLSSQPQPQLPTQPLPTSTATTASPSSELPRARSKRASTTFEASGDLQSPSKGKRKRYSDPAGPLPSLPATPFWGTVLEERPGAPSGMMPSQLGQPSQQAHPQPPHGILQPIQLPEQPQAAEQIQPQPQHLPLHGDEGRVQRTSTFPTLRLRSPLGNRHRNQMLPSLPGQLAATTSAGIYREQYGSPEVQRTPQPRPQPERGYLRRAGQLLGRLSPFNGGAASSRPSAPPTPREDRLFRQRSPGTTGLPGLMRGHQPPSPQLYTPTQRDRGFAMPRLPPLHRFQQTRPTAQPVEAVSPTGSAGSPPQQAGEGILAHRLEQYQRTEPVPQVRRGRRAGAGSGATPEQEFFECERCTSKFKRKSDKNRHVRVVHEKSRPFICPVCNKTFGEKSNMLKHRASVHDDIRTFRCPYCELTFSQRGVCDAHVRQVHDKKQAKYFCEHCGFPFSRKVQLHEHYQTVHPEYMATYGRLQTGQSSQQTTTRPMQPMQQGVVRNAGGPAYGQLQIGQSSQQTETVTATRPAQQEVARDVGGPAPTLQRQQQLPHPGPNVQNMQAALAIQRIHGGPSDPQQWVQYLPTSQPPTSGEMQAAREQDPRARSFQGDSAGNGA